MVACEYKKVDGINVYRTHTTIEAYTGLGFMLAIVSKKNHDEAVKDYNNISAETINSFINENHKNCAGRR